MDNSQSSDVFSDHSTSVSSCHGSTVIMDALDYDSLINNTKVSLCNNVQIKKVAFPNHFTSLLEDCRLCITQSLDFVANIITDSNVLPNKLTQYIENAVCLLQMLSDLIKNVVESISMSCCSFKTFPSTTGHIIMLVFTHCKNSEAIYGAQLKNMQMQLKDLFRTCHELQLTYLMVLEKHFIFDLSEREQLEIIIEALDINLKIGEVVQSLDVKTMAEQWKAYMALCEKYSSHLMDKLVYQECIQSLCSMVENNMKTALEVDQDEKVITRSLKVTNFVIKIMVKMCIIFKHASLRDYSRIIEMLIFAHLYHPSYLELQENSQQLVNGVNTNVCIPTCVLLMELISDEKFVNVVMSFNVRHISKDEKLLGYILLIVRMMKCAVEKSEQVQNFPKDKLLDCVFQCLSICHVWINIGLKIKSDSHSRTSFGLFEYILIHTTALALTVNSEEMCHLERTMYEAILGTECVTALFASNLWTALAKLSNNRQLLLTQIISLCHIYQKLENHKLFPLSPQKQHFAHTLSNLFGCMSNEDRIRLSRQFNPLDRKNLSIWTVLKISSLPRDVQRNIQEEILERYKDLISNLGTKESVDDLVEIMMLAASCTLTGVDEDVQECLVQAWIKACPRNYTFLLKTIDTGTLWYFRYVRALVVFTSALEQMFYNKSSYLVKVLHVISNILQVGNNELNLLLIDLLCNLAVLPVNDENKHSAATLVNESFRTILYEQDFSKNNVIKNKLFRIISKCKNKRLEQTIYSVVAEDPVVRKFWDNCFQSRNIEKEELKELLLSASEFKYVHKCMETRLVVDQDSEKADDIQKSCSSNFDFADLDTLFDNESDAEQPVSKKIKLDGGEAQAILNRLENDTSLLCALKENVFTSEHRRRIRDLCDKLISIVD